MHPRLERERKTIHAMIGIYCRTHHDTKGLCIVCSDLRDYADRALTRCPYKEEKPTCAKCPIHCYSNQMREQIKIVMRYSGPRMLFRHPVLAMRHTFDGRKEAPELQKKS